MVKKSLCGLLSGLIISISCPAMALNSTAQADINPIVFSEFNQDIMGATLLNSNLKTESSPLFLESVNPGFQSEFATLSILSYLSLTPAMVHWSRGDVWGGIGFILLSQAINLINGMLFIFMELGESYGKKKSKNSEIYFPLLYNVSLYSTYFVLALKPMGFWGALAYTFIGIGLIEGANQLGLYELSELYATRPHNGYQNVLYPESSQALTQGSQTLRIDSATLLFQTKQALEPSQIGWHQRLASVQF